MTNLEGTTMVSELRAWLDTQHVDSGNIGAIRARLLMPWACEWNAVVRDETAAREQSVPSCAKCGERLRGDQALRVGLCGLCAEEL